MNNSISAEFARRVISSLAKLDTIVGDLDAIVSEPVNFKDEAVREQMVRNVGDLLLVAYEIREPIVRQYPELDPYKDSS